MKGTGERVRLDLDSFRSACALETIDEVEHFILRDLWIFLLEFEGFHGEGRWWSGCLTDLLHIGLLWLCRRSFPQSATSYDADRTNNRAAREQNDNNIA